MTELEKTMNTFKDLERLQKITFNSLINITSYNKDVKDRSNMMLAFAMQLIDEIIKEFNLDTDETYNNVRDIGVMRTQEQLENEFFNEMFADANEELDALLEKTFGGIHHE